MKILSGLALAFLLVGCATSKTIRDQEYKFAEADFRFSNPEKALEDFPKKERGGFITSIEKSWISLWSDKPDSSGLLQQAKTLDERTYISAQRETEYFFFSETEEGYIPSEHEVISMHLIGAMYFLKNQQWAEARVEAKKAAFFLQSFFSPEQKHFDDPALRLWLAGVWTALGEWDEAQVDIRKAYELSKDKNLLPLLSKTKAPAEWNIIFDGSGPKPQWTYGNPYPTFVQNDERPNFSVSFSTLPWLERHQLRNSAIRDVVLKSNYMSQYYGSKLNVGGEKAMGALSVGAVRTTGIVVASAIVGGGIYLLASSNISSGTGEAFAVIVGAGFLIGKAFLEEADRIARQFKDSAEEMDQKAQENLKTYRYVRFLPSWISASEAYVVSGVGKDLVIQTPHAKNKVRFLQRF